MTTLQRDKVLAFARSQIGYVEGADNWNRYAPRVGHAQNQPWCASYVNDCFKEAGVWHLLPNHSAYTPASAQGFINVHQTMDLHHPEFWHPGDVVYFEFPGMGRISHVGIVEKWLGRINGVPTIQTLEGNTNSAGSRTGGMVCRKTRPVSMVRVVGRPRWEK